MCKIGDFATILLFSLNMHINVHISLIFDRFALFSAYFGGNSKKNVFLEEFEDSSAQITPCGHNSLQSAVQLGLLAAAAAKSSPSGWLTAEMGVCRRRSSACTRQWGQGQAVLPPICRASTISCSICRASSRARFFAEQAVFGSPELAANVVENSAFREQIAKSGEFCRSAGLAG